MPAAAAILWATMNAHRMASALILGLGLPLLLNVGPAAAQVQALALHMRAIDLEPNVFQPAPSSMPGTPALNAGVGRTSSLTVSLTNTNSDAIDVLLARAVVKGPGALQVQILEATYDDGSVADDFMAAARHVCPIPLDGVLRPSIGIGNRLHNFYNRRVLEHVTPGLDEVKRFYQVGVGVPF